MQLATLPDGQRRLIVVGTSVRKSLPVLQAYLTSLAWQEHPANVDFRYVFVPDWPTANTDAEQALRAWVAERQGEILRPGPTSAADFSDAPGLITHQWSLPAMARVGANKNRILRRALELRADAIWLVDADLVLDRTTFASLWALERPIACAVYWTHWHRQGHETRQLHAAPQVWLRHPYQLDGRGMDEAEFRAKLVKREVTRVWGQGACSLIRTPVVMAGVTFEHLQEPPLLQGMMAGEDRHFCIRADRTHIDMWADPWPDIFHVYHQPEDVTKLGTIVPQLGTEHPKQAKFGDLISVRLDALEPFPKPDGSWHRPASGLLRGRLGALPLLPELEEAVCGLQRGTNATVPIHVPVHWPLPYMRGRRRLIRVELLDVKPHSFPPNLLDEMIVGRAAGGVADSTTLSEQQLAGMKEAAGG